MTAMQIDQIILGISALSALLTALATFLHVIPKLGVHNAKLDALTEKVDSAASEAQAVASEAQAAEPAIVAIVTPKPTPPAV